MMNLSATMKLNMTATGTQAIAKDTATIANNAERAQKAMSKTGSAGLRRSGRVGGDGDGISTEEYRTQRSAAGNRGNAARNFSGLAQASGESSGLVAAYATVAANVFALTAAFKALSDAAKFEQLKKGLEEVGAKSGNTLSITAKKMQELSGYALSTVETMKSVASATAAGFSSDEIERLTRVAKGASVALGRDMSDSMDRLTRGTIKLEPELLDELGIMTRIDEATRRYALQNNLAASSLTLTQKNQAFLNAVLAEGEKKFGDIADAVDTSMYDKLSASIRDLGTQTLSVINKGLTPLIELLINVPALGLLPLMGVLSGAVGKLIPDFGKHLNRMGTELERVGEKAKAAQRTTASFFGEISETANYTTAQGATADRYLTRSGLNTQDFGLVNTKTMIKKLTMEQQALEQQIFHTTDKTSQNYQNMLNDLEAIKAVNADLAINGLRIEKGAAGFEKVSNAISLDQMRKTALQQSAQQFQNDLFVAGGGVGVFKATSDAIGRDWNIAIRGGIVAAYKETERLNNSVTGMAAKLNGIRGTVHGIGEAFGGMGGVISTAFQGLQAAMGWIFIIIGLITALGAAVTWVDETFLGNTKKLKEARSNLEAVLETSVKTVAEIDKMKGMGEFGKAADAAASSMAELLASFQEFNRVRLAAKPKEENGGGFLGFLGDFGDKGKELFVEYEQNVRSLQLAYPIRESEAFVEATKETIMALDKGSGLRLSMELNRINSTMEDGTEKLKARAAVAEAYLEISSKSVNIFKDMGVAAKGANDEIIKLRTPDAFNTPYKKIADSVSQIESGFKLASNAYKEMGASQMMVTRGYAGELFNNTELAQELGVLKDNLDEVLKLQTEYTAEGLIQQNIRNDENLSLDQKNAALKTSVERMNELKDKLYAALPPATMMLINLKNMNSVIANANLQLVKAKLTFAELQVSSMKTANSIAVMSREIGMMQKNGTADFGPEYAALKEIEAAKQSYEYAVKTHNLKMKVIELEAKAAETQFDYQKQFQLIKVQELFGDKGFKYLQQGISSNMSAEQNAAGAGFEGIPEEVRSLYNLYYELFRIMQSTNDQQKGIATLAAANGSLEIKALSVAVTAAEEKARLLNEGIKLEKDSLAQDNALFSIKKEALDIDKSLQKISQDTLEFNLRNTAIRNRTKFGPQEQYLLKESAARMEVSNAKIALDMLIEEHALKRRAMAIDHKIRLIELDNAIGTAKDNAIKNPKNAAFWNNQASRNEAVKNEVQANQFGIAIGTYKNQLGQQEVARGTVTVAENAAKAVLSPLQEFMIEFQTNNNELKLAFERLGIGGNLVGILDQGLASTAQDMSKDPRTAGMSSSQILAAAAATELMTVQTNFLNDSMESVANATNTLFKDLIDDTISTKEAFKKMAASIVADVANMVTRMIVLNAVMSMFGGTGPMGQQLLTGNAATSFSNDLSANSFVIPKAAGGIMPMAGGGVMSRAREAGRGIIKQPTYLVGEGRYHEAVVPLPNGRAIPVQMHGNNSSNNSVQVNVNMSQNGETKMDTQGPDMNNLGAAIAQAVQKELLAQKAPGGILNRYGAA